MAVKNRRLFRKPSGLESNPRVVAYLEGGHDFSILDYDMAGLEDPDGRFPIGDELLAEVWAQVGTAITEKWIADKPGTRPWAFWRFEVGDAQYGRRLDEQSAYLDRLNLLTNEERDAIAERESKWQ